MDSQNTTILEWFKKGKALTPLDALGLCGCTRLAARVLDLKEAGHNIKSMWVEVNGKRFKSYSLGGRG